MTRPFEGIRIIDITHVLAGPFAAYQLAVLGAEVIKVEHPDDPDQSRGSGTDRALNRAQMGTSFLTQGSNKRSITLDLKEERGREILKRLVARAAVLADIIKTRTADAWEVWLQARHVPAARVRTMAEAVADPHFTTRGVFHRHDSAPGVDGPFAVPLAAFKFADGGPSIETPPPQFGADTDSVLGDLGYPAAEIAGLRAAGVI